MNGKLFEWPHQFQAHHAHTHVSVKWIQMIFLSLSRGQWNGQNLSMNFECLLLTASFVRLFVEYFICKFFSFAKWFAHSKTWGTNAYMIWFICYRACACWCILHILYKMIMLFVITHDINSLAPAFRSAAIIGSLNVEWLCSIQMPFIRMQKP